MFTPQVVKSRITGHADGHLLRRVSQLQQPEMWEHPEQELVPMCVTDLKDFSVINFSSCFWDQSNLQGFRDVFSLPSIYFSSMVVLKMLAAQLKYHGLRYSLCDYFRPC